MSPHAERGGGEGGGLGRQKRLGPILCGNGSTGEMRAVDLERSATGAAQATLQMVASSWLIADCNIRSDEG